jgi:hypothetical protein
MNWFIALYLAILFFVLSPGVLLRLPKNGSKFTVAGVHALVFGVVAFFTCKFVWNLSRRFGVEGMEGKQELAVEEACRGPNCPKKK